MALGVSAQKIDFDFQGKSGSERHTEAGFLNWPIGSKAVVADIDPESTHDSLRETLRRRPQLLRRLGWHYVRVHAFDVYNDPAAVALRIAGVIGVQPETPSAPGSTQPIDVD